MLEGIRDIEVLHEEFRRSRRRRRELGKLRERDRGDCQGECQRGHYGGELYVMELNTDLGISSML